MNTMTPCTDCGMPCKPGEYHPLAACLMFKACHNSDTVRTNLEAAQDRARQAPALVESGISDREYLRIFDEGRHGSDKPAGILRGIRAVIAAYELAAPTPTASIAPKAEGEAGSLSGWVKSADSARADVAQAALAKHDAELCAAPVAQAAAGAKPEGCNEQCWACAESGIGCNLLNDGLPRALTDDDVQWIVNDNAELGVKIGQQFFFLYKGYSLVYGSDVTLNRENGIAMHDDGKPMHWRPVFKREFGECCHPINYTNPEYIGTVSLDDSGEWQPLPAALSPRPEADADRASGGGV